MASQVPLPNRIKDARRALGLTQKQAGTPANLSQAAVSFIERGTGGIATAKNIRRLCEALGLEVTEEDLSVFAAGMPTHPAPAFEGGTGFCPSELCPQVRIIRAENGWYHVPFFRRLHDNKDHVCLHCQTGLQMVCPNCEMPLREATPVCEYCEEFLIPVLDERRALPATDSGWRELRKVGIDYRKDRALN